MRSRRLLVALALAAGALLTVAAPAHAEGTEGLSHEAEECIHILEGGGDVDECHEAPSPIMPATDELVWGAISFTLLFFALSRFAWPALRKSMEDRSERIRTSLNDAEQAKTEAESVRDEYQRQLADARNEATRIIEEARQAADALKRDLTSRAEAEAAELRARNAAQIEAERARVMSELQGQVAALAIELAERVVEGNLDRETNLRLIENYISGLETTSR